MAPTPIVAKGLHVEREEILESPSHETLAFFLFTDRHASCENLDELETNRFGHVFVFSLRWDDLCRVKRWKIIGWRSRLD